MVPVVLAGLLLLLCLKGCSAAHAAVLNDDGMISAPSRLVFSQQDLALCWADATAGACVVRAPITIDEPSWRKMFAATGGVAVQSSALQPLTITTVPCSRTGGCLAETAVPGVSQPVLDLNLIPGVMLVDRGGVLRLANMTVRGLAYKSAYHYSAAQPYMSVGVGTGLWPTIGLGPNSTVVVTDSGYMYDNPSTTDSCAEYTAKNVFSFQQLHGHHKVIALNATTGLVVGPLKLTVPVKDGKTGELLGTSLSVYKNVSFTCQDVRQSTNTGLSPGTLAAAIVVPVAAVFLAAALLALWLLRRQRIRAAGRQHLVSDDSKDAAQGGAYGDVEAGGFHMGSRPGHAAPPPAGDGGSADVHAAGTSAVLWRPPASDSPESQGPDVALGGRSLEAELVQLSHHAQGQPSPFVTHAAPVKPLSATEQQRQHQLRLMQGASQQGQPMLDGGLTSPFLHHQQHTTTEIASPCDTAAHGSLSSNAAAMQHSSQVQGPPAMYPAGALSVASTVRHSSAETGEIGSTRSSLELHGFSTKAQTYCRAGADDHGSKVALLKARSDVAVLRDLKVGPLLGRGSYGRVYRGRWKATTVAIKIIEHRGAAGSGSSNNAKHESVGRETLFATTMAHPNVVTTYHISTMTMQQRSALASKWLAEAGEGGAGTDASAAAASSDDGSESDGSSTSSSDDGASPTSQLLETYVVMEFCERGSLERAITLGKFRQRSDGQPEMIGIYKALLDTAAGLGYLHSMGVVHGDLKAANVLLKGSTSHTSKGVTCKITDFGLSRVLDREGTHISTGTYGTILYMPKELLLSGRMTQATDMYSFGLMMWELLTGQPVMEEGLTIGQMFYMIAYQGWRPQLPANCPPGYEELMTACWAEDPQQRPTAQQLLKRLQRLFVQTKQQLAAEKASATPASAAAAAAAGAAAAADQARMPVVEAVAGVLDTPTVTSSASSEPQAVSCSAPCSPMRRSLEQGPAIPVSDASAPCIQPAGRRGQYQQYGLERTASWPCSSTGRRGSSQLRSSLDVSSNSSTVDAGNLVTSDGPSADGSSPADTDDYQPYAVAVLQRAATMSVATGHWHSWAGTPPPHSLGAAVAAAVVSPVYGGSATTSGSGSDGAGGSGDGDSSGGSGSPNSRWPAALAATSLQQAQQDVLQLYTRQQPLHPQQAAQLSRLPSVQEQPDEQHHQEQEQGVIWLHQDDFDQSQRHAHGLQHQHQHQLQHQHQHQPPYLLRPWLPGNASDVLSGPVPATSYGDPNNPHDDIEGWSDGLPTSESLLLQSTTASNTVLPADPAGFSEHQGERLGADGASLGQTHSGYLTAREAQPLPVEAQSDPQLMLLLQQAAEENQQHLLQQVGVLMQQQGSADPSAAVRYVETLEWAGRPEVAAQAAAAGARAFAAAATQSATDQPGSYTQPLLASLETTSTPAQAPVLHTMLSSSTATTAAGEAVRTESTNTSISAVLGGGPQGTRSGSTCTSSSGINPWVITSNYPSLASWGTDGTAALGVRYPSYPLVTSSGSGGGGGGGLIGCSDLPLLPGQSVLEYTEQIIHEALQYDDEKLLAQVQQEAEQQREQEQREHEQWQDDDMVLPVDQAWAVQDAAWQPDVGQGRPRQVSADSVASSAAAASVGAAPTPATAPASSAPMSPFAAWAYGTGAT